MGLWQRGLLGYHMEEKRVDSEGKGNERVWGAQGHVSIGLGSLQFHNKRWERHEP